MIHKIAILTPIILEEPLTKSYKETSFYKNTLLSFILNYDNTQQYMFFVGIQEDLDTFSNIETQNELKRFISVMANVNLEFYYLNKRATSLVSKWNALAYHAYINNYDYYLNITDMSVFSTKNWTKISLLRLKQNNNIGFVSFIDKTHNEYDVIMVSQKHLHVFQSFFNVILTANTCIDWLKKIYPKKNSVFLQEVEINKKQPFKKISINNLDKICKLDLIKLKKHFNYIFQE